MRPKSATIALCLLLGGCSIVEKFLGDPAADAVQAAQQQLQAGDLPGGADALQAAHAEHAQSVDAGIGAAYGAYLQADYDEADSILAAVQDLDPARLGEIRLRRALVALAAGNLDQVREMGQASGQAAGLLLAAEVALADGERDAATTMLAQASASSDAVVTSTAAQYTALMTDADPRVQGLSEAQALWALGERRVAVRSVEELVKALPEEREDKAELLLVWAGRAAAAGEAQVASNLVESIDFPPPGQQWRVIATRAIVACAEGDAKKCGSIFESIEKAAPPSGLLDARATAAILLAKSGSLDEAREIAGDEASPAVARALLAADDPEKASEMVISGPFADFLSDASGG